MDMTYEEALEFINEYLSGQWDNLEGEWADFFPTAVRAIEKCLEMGLTGATTREEGGDA